MRKDGETRLEWPLGILAIINDSSNQYEFTKDMNKILNSSSAWVSVVYYSNINFEAILPRMVTP